MIHRPAKQSALIWYPFPLANEATEMRVLLADDSGTMRTIIRRSLESLGVVGAIEAADGLQAIQLFRADLVDFRV